MGFTHKFIGLLTASILLIYLLISVGAGIYNMHVMSRSIGELEISIPLGQFVFYILFTSLCFYLKRYRLGLMVSFAFVFNWGFLHASANFIDGTGNPTLGLILYLLAGLTLAVLVLVGYMSSKDPEIPDVPATSEDPASLARREQESGICPTCHQGVGIISNNAIAPQSPTPR